jgi:hypothetical protein
MVCFLTKNPILGNFWKVWQLKMSVYFMAVWSIFQLLGIFFAIYYMLWSFGIFFPPFLVHFIKKNLATLFSANKMSRCRRKDYDNEREQHYPGKA